MINGPLRLTAGKDRCLSRQRNPEESAPFLTKMASAAQPDDFLPHYN